MQARPLGQSLSAGPGNSQQLDQYLPSVRPLKYSTFPPQMTEIRSLKIRCPSQLDSKYSTICSGFPKCSTILVNLRDPYLDAAMEEQSGEVKKASAQNEREDSGNLLFL